MPWFRKSQLPKTFQINGETVTLATEDPASHQWKDPTFRVTLREDVDRETLDTVKELVTDALKEKHLANGFNNQLVDRNNSFVFHIRDQNQRKSEELCLQIFEQLQQQRPGKLFEIAGETVMVNERSDRPYIEVDVLSSGPNAEHIIPTLMDELSSKGGYIAHKSTPKHCSLTPDYKRDQSALTMEEVEETCTTLAQKYPDAQAMELQHKIDLIQSAMTNSTELDRRAAKEMRPYTQIVRKWGLDNDIPQEKTAELEKQLVDRKRSELKDRNRGFRTL